SAAGFLASVLYPVSRYLTPPEGGEASVGSVSLAVRGSEMKPNSGVLFRFGERPGLLLRTPQGELRAFSARCTHLDCTVQYREDLSHIWCACHNGHFDLSGTNIAGPPPRPLEQFDVNLRGEEIIVTRRS
ncbi:MAG TPA: Rieske (2Fe-2S) protein, partial [Longimicrobiales bacterium]|nr:Rieske (2Fe-2S) protein [Longimicrobiales bacterium]